MGLICLIPVGSLCVYAGKPVRATEFPAYVTFWNRAGDGIVTDGSTFTGSIFWGTGSTGLKQGDLNLYIVGTAPRQPSPITFLPATVSPSCIWDGNITGMSISHPATIYIRGVGTMKSGTTASRNAEFYLGSMKSGDDPYCFLFLGGADPGRVDQDCSMQVAASRLGDNPPTWLISTVEGSETAMMTWNNVPLPKTAISTVKLPFAITVTCPTCPVIQ